MGGVHDCLDRRKLPVRGIVDPVVFSKEETNHWKLYADLHNPTLEFCVGVRITEASEPDPNAGP
jgi:hypothetical protein